MTQNSNSPSIIGFVRFIWQIRSNVNDWLIKAQACLELYKKRGSSSVVECLLAKEKVAGSSPVFRLFVSALWFAPAYAYTNHSTFSGQT